MHFGKVLLIVVSILLPYIAATSNILYGNSAATLVPPLPGHSPTLALSSPNINDPNQQWTIAGGFIQSGNPLYSTYVWDVDGESKSAGTTVILYPKKNGTNPNQQWTVQTNGCIQNGLASGYFAAPSSTYLAMTYDNSSAVSTVKAAWTLPWTCSSIGDPHITPYPGGRNDLYAPGSQQPGTFTLSKTGVAGDPDYLIIQEDQQQCLPTTPGIYCNKRGILKTQGHVIQVSIATGVTIDGVNIDVEGTYVVGNGVNVTKLGPNNYIVTYPNGKTQFTYSSYYTNIYITATGGRQPTGGVCTQFTGPNQTSRKRAITPAAFCTSWRTTNMTEDLFSYINESEWRAANPLNFTTSNGNITTTNQTLMNSALAYCAPLAPNSSLTTQCGPYLGSADMYQACLDDVIGTGDFSFAADHADAFSHQCSATAQSTNVTINLPTSAAGSVASGPGVAASIDQSSTPISFNITAKDVNGKIVTTGGDNFAVTISGGITYTLTYLGAGVYQVAYTPAIVGTFTISVLYNNAPIQNSPITVAVQSTQTDPTKSTASGPGVAPLPSTIPSATSVSFNITTRTSSGALRKTGGDTVSVTVTGFAFVAPAKDNHDGTYTVTYEQDLAGATFLVTVKVNSVPISGSPYSVYVDADKK